MSQISTDPISTSFSAVSAALADAVSAASPGVVRVDRRRGAGTGVVWAPDLVVTTSFHAPDETTVSTGTDQRKATVVGRDPGTDIAVLRIEGGGLTPATFRSLDGLAVGALTLALGRPGRTVRASLRIVGALSDDEFRTPHGGRLERWLETDRALPRGFGGGPLIDAKGEVIGMNSRSLYRGADLTVPTATLRRVVDEILAHGGVRRGYLGVGAYPIDGGALIASIEDGGPAATAGLIVGDILKSLGGEPISGPLDLRTVLLDRAGQTLDAVIVRAGVEQTIPVTIGSRP
jgi:serine protease DegQ